ncbi:RNA-guided endonuclease InsQ/TnpB family protein [Paraclostridium bifermentans]|uniref:RNA-guided endonuclease InsQ/TnpB family protein n=1 Tax=Paraclostridium bifermentans TaxID=1490 RepID=UPI000418049C|nr:RNA-guided endonuclease TnpB family protein [Paraclostridium bifermentans]GKZ03552.1 transposase [Paraclostridium bifermentans]GKZ08355.1 transposase [Paraclostridium bifermentans]GKZ08622.1 transposase [Paraclostridium bifermentans]
MIKSVKIRLIPTLEQEVVMFKSIGVSRFTYNWGLNRYNELLSLNEKPSKEIIKKEFNNTIKKQEEYKWLYEVSSQTISQVFSDLNNAFSNFYKKRARYPKFKSKRKSRQSFYVRYDALKFEDGKVNLEKIGKVKYKTNYNIPNLNKYVNPRCSFDGKYWYLSFGFEHDENQVELNDISVGIDLGIKDLATVSHINSPIKNINKSSKVRKLKKKLKRLQRQVSRKYEENKCGNKFVKTNNIIKLEKQIKLLYRKLSNIRKNHIHQATNKIIKLYPYKVVMEDLNVSGMMKNKHLSKAIAEQCFYEFIRQMKYKCEFNKIEFIQADRFFPSSKKCSCCGEIKQNLKLKDRVYKCDKCGFKLDRDKNASINLSYYEKLA